MEERGNKTIMCSVLFLDIVEYSKKSVAGQISLKDRFNSYLSAAIRNVPMSDRIILDTGDGAAINFLGDIEDAMKAALSLRESLLNEDPHLDPPLLVRVGINLGPVRLVRDINGQPNIVGDGINVAQRVMGFADVSQILVSRSYYDAVSRLSPQYAGMFHYQGSRTDKHVREHEVYAIGYPGDKTTESMAAYTLAEEESKSSTHVLTHIKGAWDGAASKLDDVIKVVVARFAQAEPKQRALYAAAIGVPLVLLVALTVKLAHRGESPAMAVAADANAVSAVLPVSSVVAGSRAPVHAKEAAAPEKATEPTAIASKSNEKKTVENKNGKDKAKHAEAQAKTKSAREVTAHKADNTQVTAEHSNEAYISMSCSEGTLLFVDGTQKGKITSGSVTATVVPGKHTVIASHPSKGIFSQNVELEPGKTARIKPPFCN